MMHGHTYQHLQMQQHAAHLYSRAVRAGWLARAKARLAGTPVGGLAVLSGRVQSGASVATARVEAAAIPQIIATTEQCPALDATFAPRGDALRAAWVALAVQQMQGHELPPVHLLAVEDVYSVCDRNGAMRVSVARGLGQHYIDAVVTPAVGNLTLHLPTTAPAPAFAPTS